MADSLAVRGMWGDRVQVAMTWRGVQGHSPPQGMAIPSDTAFGPADYLTQHRIPG